MSSNFLSNHDLTMIEGLLIEFHVPQWEWCSHSGRARELIFHFANGMTSQEGLRIELLRYRVRNGPPGRRREQETLQRRQEHILPSPEEEFDVSKDIRPIEDASHQGMIVGINTDGETAIIQWSATSHTPDSMGCWTQMGTLRPFEAVQWVSTTWRSHEITEYLERR